ncbi:MAG: outer membrane beta-barrel protein [Gammaproteobacteria bacterium]|nr:outer membrane beta-barrel protein [Gammaproteobacteria bacterium]
MRFATKAVNLNVICLVSLLGSSVSVHAQNSENYITFGLGITSTDETSFQVAPGTIDTEFEDDWNYSAAYGWKRLGYRYEVELVLGEDEVSSHSLNGGAPLEGAIGGINMAGVLLNGYYDFATASAFTPYVGAGLGVAMIEAEGFGVDAIPDVLDDDDTVIAYQIMAGIGYELSDRTNLFAEYRYLGTESAEVTTSVSTGSVVTDLDFGSTQFRFGVRISL